MTIISSILVIGSLIGGVFAVDARYITKAEASDKDASIQQRQQFDRVEVDTNLVNLEIQFLESILEEDPEDKEALKRLEYLKERRLILDKYMIELKHAK